MFDISIGNFMNDTHPYIDVRNRAINTSYLGNVEASRNFCIDQTIPIRNYCGFEMLDGSIYKIGDTYKLNDGTQGEITRIFVDDVNKSNSNTLKVEIEMFHYDSQMQCNIIQRTIMFNKEHQIARMIKRL